MKSSCASVLIAQFLGLISLVYPHNNSQCAHILHPLVVILQSLRQFLVFILYGSYGAKGVRRNHNRRCVNSTRRVSVSKRASEFSMKLQIFALLTCFCVSRADFSPPVVNISLDVPADQRWAPLKNLFDMNVLREAASEVIDKTVPKWVHNAIKPVVRALEKYIPQPYAGEIQGLSSIYGSDISDIVLLNFAYEVSAFCTSIVTQDIKGNIYHGRNMDYPFDVLRNFTLDIHFIKNGKVAYRGTTFAGYVGLWTGQSRNKFTVTANERNKGHWWENVISAVFLKRSPVSWLVRRTLEEALDFRDAVIRLAKVPIIADVYYIVGGVRPGEGVVITRDRSRSADIWPLDPLNGNWYRVETNYDHWLPPPKRDHRRDVAMKALNATGQNHISMNTLFQVLSVTPVRNRVTIFTTVMSAAIPDNYTTFVRDAMVQHN